MKTKSTALLALVLSLAALPLVADGKSKTPDLKVDASPLVRAAAPPVSYADALEPVRQAVVSVYSTKIVRQRLPQFFRQFYPGDLEREQREQGLGSGVIVTPDGYILTNNHVVADADELEVRLPDERRFPAKLVSADPKTDIAVIKIDAEKLPVATLADSDQTRVGDVVFAVGNPLGVGQTVTMGIISATGRNNLGLLEDVAGYENFIQTDAPINAGNSGGALVDAKGRLVGINTAIVSPSRGNIGIGFSIPSNLAVSVMHSLLETGGVPRGFLGVTMGELDAGTLEALDLPAGTTGVYVTNVLEGGPAAKAGVLRNDIITAVTKTPVTTPPALRPKISQTAPGAQVELSLIRDGKPLKLKAVLETLDAAALPGASALEGVTLEPLTRENRRGLGIERGVTGGLLVTGVAPESPHAGRLAPGMLIVEVNRKPVSELPDLRASLKTGHNLLLVYWRGAFRPLPVLVK
ncbi:MAG: Do family serine endopeptidase [Opitutaceae bacterium]|jgi:serine protease Do/serine protease DegQ|nr:Do family serine endopeptidase [Opitutaceae bacterium]